MRVLLTTFGLIFLMYVPGFATLNLVAKVSEGLVLTSDSRSSYSNRKQDVRVASENAEKLLQISSHIGCLIRGQAFFEGWTAKGFLDAFRTKHELGNDSRESFDSVLVSFKKWCDNELDSTSSVKTWLIFAGYDLDGEPRIAEYNLATGMTYDHLVNERVGLVFKGQTEAIDRLLRGYSKADLIANAGLAFVRTMLVSFLDSQPECLSCISLADSLPPQFNKKVYTQFMENVKLMNAVVPMDKMYLQDAIDYARFLTRTSVDFQRFTDGTTNDPGGVPGIGGEVDIAVITQDGFRWIARKELR